VVFDTWAWWEVLHATETGKKLASRYLGSAAFRVLTADLALVELSAKLARDGRQKEIRLALAAVDSTSEVVPISTAAAAACGPLLVELRRTHKGASLADAVMLAVARTAGARLVSGDGCFAGQRDVTAF
jgi:predicted nucleic acid-binding protein